MVQIGPLRSQSLFQFVQISDEYFEHFLFQYFPHSELKSAGFKYGEFRDDSYGEKNL